MKHTIPTSLLILLSALAVSCSSDTSSQWVDMGGTVLWATCNLGASAPEEFGDYFAWGETKPKQQYTEDNSLTYQVEITDWAAGQANALHDAATANWGWTCRMPTIGDFDQLLKNCEYHPHKLNGVEGILLKSKTTGNTLFLPAAGNRRDSQVYNQGQNTDYWMSTYEKQDIDYSSSHMLHFTAACQYPLYAGYRNGGLPIRAVRDK